MSAAIEKSLRLLAESLPDPVAALEAVRGRGGAVESFRVEFANAAAREASADVAGMRDACRRVLETGEPLLRRRIQLPPTPGADAPPARVVEVSAVKAGEDAVTLTWRDATSQQRTEIERALLASAVEQCGDSVAVCDRSGKILYVNPAFERSSGYKREELKGQTPRVLKSGRHEPAFYEELWRTILAGKVFRGEFCNRRRDGSLFYTDRTIAPIVGASGRIEHFVATGHDAAPRREKEETIRRLNEELERRVAQRTVELSALNRELEAFAYSVSHDLRAPLRHIQGFLELFRAHGGAALDAKSAGYLDLISGAASRMSKLIDDLLDFSRMAHVELRMEPVDLAALAREVRDKLSAEAGDRPVEWRIAALPKVQGDEAMLRVVLTNLLSNALKFTRGRAPALITIDCGPGEDGRVVIRVKDNGAGFDMRFAGKLFGVFQRLHAQSEYEGTGIGLATVRRIVQRHGGRAWACGVLGRGATICFSLKAAG